MSVVAEANLVIGLISGVIAIIDATKKVYDAASDATGLPEAFREVAQRLPLVQNTLTAVKTDAQVGKWDAVRTNSIKKTLESCQGKSKKLEKIFKDVIPGETASRIDRYIIAARTLGKGSRVETLMKGVLDDMALVAGNQVAGLSEAIRAISDLKPSLTAEQFPEFDTTYSHSGSGDINHADRDQYISSGDNAKQWNIGSVQTITFVTSPKDKSSCLHSLRFSDMNYRNIELLKDITPGTCDWILLRPEYQKWNRGSTRLLWIKGNPGTGKSSLLAFVFKELITKSKDIKSQSKELILSFFFHRRGSHLQKTRLGMFRTFLYQIVRAVPESCAPLLEDFIERQESTAPGERIEWHENELGSFLLMILSTPGFPRKVIIFVDALDEALDEAGKVVANDLITYFYKLLEDARAHSVSLKICFSSRPYPILWGLSTVSHIAVEDHNMDGLVRYIRDSLMKLSPDDTVKKHDATKEMEHFISKNAKGVFQWARLVLETLAKADRERESLTKLHARLRNIPTDLHEMYEHLLRGVLDEGHRLVTTLLFQWVCFAAKPLSIDEIRHALAFDDEYMSWENEPESRFPDLEADAADLEIRIKVWSAGLIEIKKRQNTTFVQIIHQTVADFFQDEGGQKTLFPGHESMPAIKGKSHDRLAKTCLNYLRQQAIRQEVDPVVFELKTSAATKIPLLRYVVQNWPFHAGEAENHGYLQTQIVDRLGYPSRKSYLFWPISYPREGRVFNGWLSMQLSFGADDFYNAHAFNGSTLVHIAAAYNLHSTLTELERRWVNSRRELDANGQTALHYAVRAGHISMVQRLLDLSFCSWIDVNAECYDSASAGATYPLLEDSFALDSDKKPPPTVRATALMLAVWHNHTEIIRLLLKMGAKIKVYDDEKYGYLCRSDGRDYSRIIPLLIADREEFQSQNLSRAIADGDLERIKMLVRQGAFVDATDRLRGMTALHLAALNGNLELVDLLLGAGADVEAVARYIQGSALSYSHRPSLAERFRDGVRALCAADRYLRMSRNGWKIISDKDVDPEVRSLRCYPLLKQAFGIPETLTSHGTGLTPLRIAAGEGHLAVVERLLAAGAKANILIDSGLTAIEAALKGGHSKVVAELQRAGADMPGSREEWVTL